MTIELAYKQWCKDTKRNGGVLVGGSINEFFTYLSSNYNIKLGHKSNLILRSDEEVKSCQVKGYKYIIP